jgi:hypothetical protein
MAAVAAPPAPAAKYDAEVRARLAQAERRIRTQDVLFGVLVLAAVGLGYLAAAVTLDRLLDLPGWARQIGFLGLLGVMGVVAARWVARPLRRRVNPLFAAKQVEETVADAKNGIVNWVDLQDRGLPEPVRAMVGARAARQMRDADLDHAGETRKLVWAGGAVGGLVAGLAVLFLLFRPAVFGSLVGRALNPFAAGGVATRTRIDLVEPAGGDATITAGQPFTVAVRVDGRVPDADGPDRLRVLLRHNPADPNFEEVPLEPAGGSRDWAVRVPEYLVQNGFWFKVAGGDGSTEEHRLTVRPRPAFTGYEVSYEYPAYLRMDPETGPTPAVEAYRGTVVTVTAKANRQLRDGRAVLAGRPVAGQVVGDDRDRLRVRFTLDDPSVTGYRLLFTAAGGEQNLDAPQHPITVLVDRPPTITLDAPKEEAITLPANGLLAVDAAVGDDFGIDTVALRLQLKGYAGLALKGKPFQGGKSFRREADGTFPNSLAYKDSIKLAELTDEAGKPVPLKEGTVLEYWLEAIDNCTVPGPNVGRSKVQSVKLGPPLTEPAKQAEQQQAAARRAKQEADHRQAQQKKLDAEQRPKKESPQKKEPPTDAAPPPKPAGDGPEKSEPQAEKPAVPPMNDPTAPPQGEKPAQPPTPDAGQPMPPQKAGQPAAGDAKADDRQIEEQATQVQKAIDEQRRQAGGAKGNDPPPAAEPPAGAAKPNPDPTGEGASEPKAGGDPGAAGQPKPQPDKPAGGQPGEPKPGNDPGKGADPKPQPGAGQEKGGEPKPGEKAGPDKTPDAGGAKGPKPGEPQPGQPKAGEQPQPADARPAPGDGAEKPGDARGDRPTPPAAAKKPPQDDATGGQKGGPPADAKPQPAGDPMQAKGGPGQPGAKDAAAAKVPQPPGELDREPGGKGDPQQARKEGPNEAEKLSREDIQQAADMLANGNERQKQDARDRLDKGMGRANREQLEKQADELAKKQKSGNPQDQADANRKLDDFQRKAEQHAGQQAGGGQPDPKQAERMRKDLEQAARDLASDDPKKQEQARQKLDGMIGKENRERAEKEAQQLAKDLQSGDPEKRKAAEQKLDQIRKQAEQMAKGGGQPDPKAGETVEKATKDLANGNEQQKQAARDQLDKTVGEQGRQKAEQIAKDLNSPDPAKRDAAREQLNQLQREAERNGGRPAPKDAEQLTREMEKAANDLANGTPERKEAARKKLDQMMGENARKQAEKEAEQLANDLQSGDQAKREAAEKKLDELRKKAEQATKGGGPPDPKAAEQAKEMQDAAKDLANGTPEQKQAARDKLDKAMGEAARKQAERDAEQLAKDLQSGDPGKQEAARKKLDELKKQAEQTAKNGQPGEQGGQPDAKAAKEANDIAKDLANGTPEQKQAAREKLDRMAGDAKPQADQIAKDLQSGDPGKREAAEKKLAEMAKQAAKAGEPNGKPDPKAAEQVAKDLRDAADKLANGTEPEKQQAREKLDRMIGEDARKQAEQMAKDLQSKDPATREAAQKKLADMAKQAAEQAAKAGEQPPGLLKEEIEKLARAAKDLASKDDAARQKAEQELDKAIGPEARKAAQKQAEQQAENPDPGRQEELQKQIEAMTQQRKGQNRGDGRKPTDLARGGIGNLVGEDGKPLEDNPENRKKAAELQLTRFKEALKDKGVLDRLGYTEEEARRFLEGYEKRVQELAKEAEQAKAGPPAKTPDPKVPTRRADASGRVTQRADGSAAAPQAAGAAVAPPGYGDARRKFAQGAAKVAPDEKK